ncbi:MAG: acetyl-CoA carboxylase carboxyl transferase subunit alpha [Lachnospiraceae bacterium]|nr:acetyl-CoA carboxylase carboxyl transferase subunit alpha [Lachnospiraceae bacterium]
MEAYERLLTARDAKRSNIDFYINELFDDFIELHGDRLYKDDKAIVAGIGIFHDIPVTVIGHRKGKDTQENIECNFGMASPEGYRKAVRLMKQAEKFNRPVITFVDTPGAYPGVEAESNGQSNAIAESIACMSNLKVPVISIITGEGSSGGAIALAVADKVWMLENAVYSILSPEGFASIMWKDASRAKEACDIMKITAQELYNFGIIDGVIRENKKLIVTLDGMIYEELKSLQKKKPEVLVKERYMKFRKMDGLYNE